MSLPRAPQLRRMTLGGTLQRSPRSLCSDHRFTMKADPDVGRSVVPLLVGLGQELDADPGLSHEHRGGGDNPRACLSPRATSLTGASGIVDAVSASAFVVGVVAVAHRLRKTSHRWRTSAAAPAIMGVIGVVTIRRTRRRSQPSAQPAT